MKVLVKVLAGLGAIVLTATAVAMPDLCKIKAPIAVQGHETHRVPGQLSDPVKLYVGAAAIRP